MHFMHRYIPQCCCSKLAFCVGLVSKLSYSTQIRNHNLKNLLLNMPKEPKLTENLQKVRSKLKEKGQKYVPGTVTLKVLGSGAKGTPRSLYVFTDQSRYLFNCGEGTQRLAHEHKMRLSKLEHIFVTYPSWENIGGLPGIALTIQDVGVPKIMLHGPAGLDEIFPATRRFVVLKDLQVSMAECTPTAVFQDPVMSVNYVPLRGKSPLLSDVAAMSESEDDVDYYEHERKRKIISRDRAGGETKRSRLETDVAMSFVCKLRDRPGSLSLERCVDKKVPAGPMLGQLKAGQDVTLKDGTVVRSVDVCLPDEPGPVFIVVECPTLDYVDALLREEAFAKHQATATVQANVAHLVVHFSPHSVVQDARYQEWMDRFSPSTQHLVLNDSNECMGSVAVHRIQHKLNMLHDDIFPLLADSGIPVEQTADCKTTDVQNETNGTKADKTSKVTNTVAVIQGRTLCNFHLRPFKGLDRSEELKLQPAVYTQETRDVEHFPETLATLKSSLNRLVGQTGDDTAKQTANGNVGKTESAYPKLVFLGTGSCIPNKTRNTSAILLQVNESCNIMLDCGEGTYGQLVRFYGSEVDAVLRRLRAIYVSHLHADHHIGLVGLLKGRSAAFAGAPCDPVFLIAPKQIKSWLNVYHRTFEPVLQHLHLIPNGTMYLGDHKLDSALERRLLDQLCLDDVNTVLVNHCPNAFGVSFTHPRWKISYSGDTMPCDDFIKLGEGSDVLIHEATMEDELEMEARLKLHSTTSQAITVGRRMRAKFTLLTHFSQRYAKLPRLDDNMLDDNVGIAFDNMQVSVDHLTILPRLYPSLKLMFADHHEELELKSVRRNLKREREKLAVAVT